MYSLRTIAQPTVEPVSLDTFKAHLRLDSDDEDDLLRLYLSAARSHAEKLTQRAFLPQTVEFALDRFPYGYTDRNRSVGYHSSSSLPDWVDLFTVRLPRPTCLAVASITYTLLDGTVITLDPRSYILDSAAEPARLIPANGWFWPVTFLSIPGSVRITYIAGSYALPVVETLTVPAQGPTNVTLSRVFAGGAVALSQMGLPVPYTNISDSQLAVNASLAGQAVTASYYGTNIPGNVTAAVMLLAAHLYRNREAASDVAMKEIPLGVQSLLADEICYAGAFEL